MIAYNESYKERDIFTKETPKEPPTPSPGIVGALAV